jgi:glycosyltransferase involved in cell wall biosynthesis
VRAPLVTVVLPVFNAASTVARAVESIARQTFADWELLAIDDGSTDGTPAVLAELARGEPRLRVLTRSHDGLLQALNTALAGARGEFIARMDADDEAHPERFAEQVGFLRQHPEVGVVGSLVKFGGDPARAGGYALHVDWMNGVVTPEAIALNRFIESPFAHPSVMFRRELVQGLGGYREGDFPEDYELWLRWLDAGVAMAKVPRVLLTWNDPPARLSRSDPRYDPEAFYRCKAPYLARWWRHHVAPSRRVLVWGAGRPTRKRAEHLTGHGLQIGGYIDIDPRKVGRVFAGRSVIAPQDLPAPGEVFVLGYVAKHGARELARSRLLGRGYTEGRDFLMAA